MTEMKERFLSIWRQHICRPGADKLLAWLETSDFFTAPASTRFHGAHEGGLLAHSLHVYDCLLKIAETEGQASLYSGETLALTALMHDLCKVTFYRETYRNVKSESGAWEKKKCYEIAEQFPCGDHADKSVIILQGFMALEPEEIMAIRAHMGGFDSAVKGGGGSFISKIFETSRLAVWLHLADMAATYLREAREANHG